MFIVDTFKYNSFSFVNLIVYNLTELISSINLFMYFSRLSMLIIMSFANREFNFFLSTHMPFYLIFFLLMHWLELLVPLCWMKLPIVFSVCFLSLRCSSIYFLFLFFLWVKHGSYFHVDLPIIFLMISLCIAF